MVRKYGLQGKIYNLAYIDDKRKMLYLPDFILKDGVGFEVDCEGNLAQLKVIDKPVSVCF